MEGGAKFRTGMESGSWGISLLSYCRALFSVNALIWGGRKSWSQIPGTPRHIRGDPEIPADLSHNVPSLYQLLMANPKFKTLDHSSLKCLPLGGLPVPRRISRRSLERIIGTGKLLEVMGCPRHRRRLHVTHLKETRSSAPSACQCSTSILKLVDPANGNEVGVGEAGELWVKGPVVTVGYYKKPEETKNAFDADGYMHTGDVAVRTRTVSVTLVYRTKDMINISGFKVFSVKVEDVAHPASAIDMVATVGVRSGAARIRYAKAFVQLRPDIAETTKIRLKRDITSFAKEQLTLYEVLGIEFDRDQLPLTAVGKVDKKRLREQ